MQIAWSSQVNNQRSSCGVHLDLNSDSTFVDESACLWSSSSTDCEMSESRQEMFQWRQLNPSRDSNSPHFRPLSSRWSQRWRAQQQALSTETEEIAPSEDDKLFALDLQREMTKACG